MDGVLAMAIRDYPEEIPGTEPKTYLLKSKAPFLTA